MVPNLPFLIVHGRTSVGYFGSPLQMFSVDGIRSGSGY